MRRTVLAGGGRRWRVTGPCGVGGSTVGFAVSRSYRGAIRRRGCGSVLDGGVLLGRGGGLTVRSKALRGPGVRGLAGGLCRGGGFLCVRGAGDERQGKGRY